jgi:hypothetical protein
MKLKKLQKKQKKGKYDGPALPETIILDIPTPRYALYKAVIFTRSLILGPGTRCCDCSFSWFLSSFQVSVRLGHEYFLGYTSQFIIHNIPPTTCAVEQTLLTHYVQVVKKVVI